VGHSVVKLFLLCALSGCVPYVTDDSNLWKGYLWALAATVDWKQFQFTHTFRNKKDER